MTASEQIFTIGGLDIYAKRWGAKGANPVMALHGWLDNAASFDFLAPLLEGCDLVCIDCAGHGKSGHRSHLGAYNIWQDIGELFAVADQLGWSEFSLIGHSRGAMISFLAAGTFPMRIKKLVLLEGGSPRTAEPEQAPQLLADAIRTVRLSAARKRQTYPTFADAVAVRANGLFPIAECDAEMLARHSVQETPDGFIWSYDAKLLAGSEVRFSSAQVAAFREQVRADTLVILANQGLILGESGALDFFNPNWRIAKLPGGHHLHMHEQATTVATLINAHLNSA